MDVHRHEAARQAARGERRFAGRLHVGVDREPQVVAGDRRLRDELAAAGRLAEGVDLDPGRCRRGRAGSGRRCTRPRPGRSRRPARARGSARSFSCSSVDLADVAEDVGGERPVRVAADEDALHARPRGSGPGSPAGSRRGSCRRRGAGSPARPAPASALRAIVRRSRRSELWVSSASRASSARRSPRSAGQLARVDLEGEAGAVGDQDLAVAVEDLAARGADPELAGAVVLRFGQVLCRRSAPAGTRGGRRGPRRGPARRRRRWRCAAPAGCSSGGRVRRSAGTSVS